MGPAFVLLFWFIIVAIYSVIFLALVGLSFWGWRKKNRILKYGAGIPAGMMALVAILIAGLIIYGIFESKNPIKVFEKTFDIPPSAAVSNIQSDLYWFADYGSVYLRFQTTAEEFEKLIPSGLKKNEDLEDVQQFVEYRDMCPSWWDFKVDSKWVYYSRGGDFGGNPSLRSFSNETECFAYNPDAQIAYFRFIGID